MLQSGDALFIPNGDGHVLLSDDQATVVNVSGLPSEPVCDSVSCVKNACDDAKSDSPGAVCPGLTPVGEWGRLF